MLARETSRRLRCRTVHFPCLNVISLCVLLIVIGEIPCHSCAKEIFACHDVSYIPLTLFSEQTNLAGMSEQTNKPSITLISIPIHRGNVQGNDVTRPPLRTRHWSDGANRIPFTWYCVFAHMDTSLIEQLLRWNANLVTYTLSCTWGVSTTGRVQT